jgi:hypothetical protein
MRNNKAILDEAARSVRRTFIGSVAGTTAMLGVVGAAGAYGMPENLTAQALTAAMMKLNVKFAPKVERADATTGHPVQVAENLKPRAASPVSDVVLEDSIVRTIPQVAALATPAAVPAIAPPIASSSPIESSSVIAKTPAVEILPRARNPFEAADAALTPATTASIAPRDVPAATREVAPVVREEPAVLRQAPAVVREAPVALREVPAAAREAMASSRDVPAVTRDAPAAPRAVPPVAAEHPFLSAPMVFAAATPADAQMLTELPKTEVVGAAPEPVAPKQAEKPAAAAAPFKVASLVAEPTPDMFPKVVSVLLPVPKPPLTPAQRLDLAGKEYDKAEKCLAQAVYFEARNEPARGQQAVAQVVMNRVFSPYYPKDVCSVVYQNAHRHLSCQFTFACDGKPEATNERGAWARANRIAKQTLDAKVWLPEVNKATHYHAAYVRPSWIRDMKVMVRYGLHTFYRPRNWGDGSDEAHWGTAKNTVKPAAAEPVKALTPAQKRFAYRRT